MLTDTSQSRLNTISDRRQLISIALVKDTCKEKGMLTLCLTCMGLQMRLYYSDQHVSTLHLNERQYCCSFKSLLFAIVLRCVSSCVATAGFPLIIHLQMPNTSGITPCTMSVGLQAGTPQTLLVRIGAVSLCQHSKGQRQQSHLLRMTS